MATVTQTAMPATLQIASISASDATAQPVVSSVAGKIVRVWGFHFKANESLQFKSNTTAISPAISTTGLAVAIPQPHAPNGRSYPHYESASGETINIVFGATGGSGTVYYSQD